MTRTNRLLIVVLVAAAAVAAFWFLALAPKREQAAQLQQQIVAKQTELDTARRQVATYERARAAYSSNYAAVARLGKAVPADDDVRSLMVQLDAAARRSGVDFDVIDVGKGASVATGASAADAPRPVNVIPGASENPAGFSTLPMAFSFRGSYFELSGFFTRLERFVTVSNQRIDVTGRLLILQSLSLVPDEEKGFPQMRAQIGATSYLVPAAQGITAGATAQGPAPAATPAATPAGGTTASTTTATVTGAVR